MEEEFPANSHRSKRGDEPPEKEEKRIEVVASATRRKKGLGRQFRETFIGGSAKTAWSSVVTDVLIPSSRDILSDLSTQLIDRIIYGESRHGRARASRGGPTAAPTGYVSYNKYAMGAPDPRGQVSQPRSISAKARASHDFDEIVLESRPEAERVLEQLFDIVSAYAVASVSDLYRMVGLSPSHTDQKWGWSNLQDSGVSRIRGGWVLDLPEPEPID